MGGRKRQLPRPKIVTGSPLTGAIVIPFRGRERGRTFIVVGGSDTHGHVYIADGRKRLLCAPKLKSISHMKICGECARAAELLPKGDFTDGDIRRAILAAELKDETPKGESNAEG